MEADLTRMKPVTFVVAMTVHPTWIADGFMLTDERARSMLSYDLNGAHNSEIAARVIHVGSGLEYAFGPRLQGFKDRALRAEIEKYRAATPMWNELRKRLARYERERYRGIAAFADLLSPGTVPQEGGL